MSPASFQWASCCVKACITLAVWSSPTKNEQKFDIRHSRPGIRNCARKFIVIKDPALNISFLPEFTNIYIVVISVIEEYEAGRVPHRLFWCNILIIRNISIPTYMLKVTDIVSRFVKDENELGKVPVSWLLSNCLFSLYKITDIRN